MSESLAAGVSVSPLLQFPRLAEFGKTYLFTIDLRPQQSFDSWPYPDEEEVIVYCLLNTIPLFHCEPLGEPSLVLHRFGGTYGPARFLLTASQEAREGVITITLVNRFGVPLTVFETPPIQIQEHVAGQVVADNVSRTTSQEGADALITHGSTNLGGGIGHQDFTDQVFPFNNLTPSDFERLCLRLIQLEGYSRSEFIRNDSLAGIAAYKTTGNGPELWYFSCKQQVNIDARTFQREVVKCDDLFKKDLKQLPRGIFFITSSAVPISVIDAVGKTCRELGYAYEFWGRDELNFRVRRHPTLVEEYFRSAHPGAHLLPVFISSTWLDLRPEREATERTIQSLRETTYVGIECFSSHNEETRTASLNEVDRSSVYIGIIAGRYGTGTIEAEYERARELGLPCFVYLKADAAISEEGCETDLGQISRLTAFKRRVRGAHIVAEFDSPIDLTAKVMADLRRWLFDDYLTPKLNASLRGEITHSEAQALLDGIKDSTGLGNDLIAKLHGAGFNIKVSDAFVSGDKVTNIYNAPAPTVPALHQLPPPPSDFTGRVRELDELLSQIERGGVTISGLQGLGGIGKTALALKLAQQLAPRYPDAQFYLDLKGAARQPLSVTDALAHVVRAYHPMAKLPESEPELKALYLSVLHGRRALLLMDNAAGREQVESLVPPEGCVLLVTSRQHFTLPGLLALNLDTLPPADARELLLKIAPRIGDYADEIANLCGYLPLALRLAASALAERVSLSPMDYVRRLSDAKTRLSLVEASFNLSYELLPPELQSEWASLAVFSGTFSAEDVARVWNTDQDATQDILSDLVRYSMVEWDAVTYRYYLHDLARLFARARYGQLEKSLLTAQKRHATHYLQVLRAAENLYLKGGDEAMHGLSQFDLEWPNIQAGQAWAQREMQADSDAAALCGEYPTSGMYLLNLRMLPRERVRWLSNALEAARLLNNRLVENNALSNLGVAYADLGETRSAIRYFEEALQIAREIKDYNNECLALNNLGLAYSTMGDLGQAANNFELALAIARESGNRRLEGDILNNLGRVYANMNDVQSATDFYVHALAIAREIGDRLGEANALGNIGLASAGMGDVKRAIEIYEESLAIAREIGDRRGEGNALYNISIMLNRAGDYARAIALAEASLGIFEQVESPYVERVRALLRELRGHN